MTVTIENTMTVTIKNTWLTIEPDKVYTSRTINNRLYSMTMSIDGSMEDLIAKCERVSKLDDEMYELLSKISVGAD